jgi:fructosamine-3-kinase
MTNDQLRITNYELRITNHQLRITNYELFGGFPPTFYQGYQEVFPLDKGYETRKTLYNLYHILNHFNLFGNGYYSQANQMIEKILKASNLN